MAVALRRIVNAWKLGHFAYERGMLEVCFDLLK